MSLPVAAAAAVDAVFSLPLLLSQAMPELIQHPRAEWGWAPVVLLIVMGLGFAVVNILASTIIGPSRTGPGKESTYESGMVPVGDTRKRFNVRFYVLAMIFLVIDVEIVFFYPWATVFPRAAVMEDPYLVNALLVRMGVFVALLLVGYLYAWGKGVFRWE